MATSKETDTQISHQLIANFTQTTYTSHLESKQVFEYNKKLSSLEITDPYCVPDDLYRSLEDLGPATIPDLSYPDIYNYLIHFPSYTGDSLKAYKSLQGYKWNVSGFVNKPRIWKLPPPKTISVMTANVS